MDLDKIEEDFLKVKFLLKWQFKNVGYFLFYEKYGLIEDIITDCLIDPEFEFVEIEAMALLKHLYSNMIEEYGEQIKDIPDSVFEKWLSEQ